MTLKVIGGFLLATQYPPPVALRKQPESGNFPGETPFSKGKAAGLFPDLFFPPERRPCRFVHSIFP